MSAEDFKAKAAELQKAGKYDEAIDAYTEAIKLDGTNKVYYSNRSAAYLAKGDANSALADGEKCVSMAPEWPRSYTRQGQALHSLKRYDEAEQTYEAGVAACPGDAGLADKLKEIKDLKARQASGPPPGAANPFGNILGKLAGHPKFSTWMSDPAMMQKINLLQTNPQMGIQMCMSDPSMSEVLEAALGISLRRPEDMGASPMDTSGGASSSSSSSSSGAAAAEKAAPPEPPRELTEEEKEAEAVKSLRSKGNDHYKKKEFDQALACYDEVLARDSKQVSVLSNKAAVYMEQGDLDKAEKQCEEAIEKAREMRPTPFEDIAKFYVRWGKVYVKRKDLGRAIELWQTAQMEYSDKATERLIKTTMLEKKKQDKLAYVNPELAKEAKERGNDAFRSQDWATAIKEYEEAIKRDPSEASYHNNLAATLSKVMDFQGAKREVDKALELDDKYVKAWARKGDIEFLMKEFHKAMESYQKGLAIEPNNRLCTEGMQKTVLEINKGSSQMSDDEQRERAAHGMADPEIQAILTDPVVRQVIQDLGTNDPVAQRAGQKAMQDPVMSAKIQKLIAAGVLRTG